MTDMQYVLNNSVIMLLFQFWLQSISLERKTYLGKSMSNWIYCEFFQFPTCKTELNQKLSSDVGSSACYNVPHTHLNAKIFRIVLKHEFLPLNLACTLYVPLKPSNFRITEL